ncbi:MAG: sialate O-acetylesterase [Granulosicoccus sp.]
MNYVTFNTYQLRPGLRVIMLALLGLIGACSSDTQEPASGDSLPTADFNDPPPTGDFEIRSSFPELILTEGDEQGLRIPLSLLRTNGHSRDVTLEVRGRTTQDVAFVTSSFSRLTLTPSTDESEAFLKLAISATPILPQQRDFIITASDGLDTDSMSISVTVEPTSAPDVYLLVGQSNMEGFSGDGTRRSAPGGADEPNPRIKQLNVSKNDDFEVFRTDEDFTSPLVNVVEPDIVIALDPLHLPQDPSNESGKEQEFIGLGLSFAKRALQDTSAEVLLVPAAWSGSSFCNNDNGPRGNWMSSPSTNADLGNTLLFDRAVARANLALEKSGGVFRGILWHQGESDANEKCAPLYQGNLQQMVSQFRARIAPVGNSALRRVESTIPFVAGTMSRGVDERGDLSVYLASKQMIDDVHRSVDSTIEAAAWSNHDDLIPANGFPCGNSSCIHFGPDALREMGRRYYDGVLRAVNR